MRRSHDLPRLHFTDGELLQARIELSEFVMVMADRTAKRVGFGFAPSDSAPNNWRDLQAAWLDSQVNGTPLPVFSSTTPSATFVSAEATWAFRFWHDVTHLERERDFSSPHEIDMASFHLWETEQHGLEYGSLPWRLLQADAVGSVIYWAVYREPPTDEHNFILNYLEFGIEAAVLAEAARTRKFAPQVLPLGIAIWPRDEPPLEPAHWVHRP